jgi:hypothetical protein
LNKLGEYTYGKTTFTGPVTSLNGFIGGANVNAGDTQQGGNIAWTVSNASTVTMHLLMQVEQDLVKL